MDEQSSYRVKRIGPLQRVLFHDNWISSSIALSVPMVKRLEHNYAIYRRDYIYTEEQAIKAITDGNIADQYCLLYCTVKQQVL